MNITLTVTIFHKLILWSILWRSHMFSSYVFCRSLLKLIWQLHSVCCNLYSISVFIPQLSGDLAVSGLFARLMSVYWARTRAEDPGSGELRPGLRVRWSLSPTVLSGLQNHFVSLYPRAHCRCSAILAPILFDFCISLITRNSRGTMRKIHTSCTLKTFQITALEYWDWPKSMILI